MARYSYQLTYDPYYYTRLLRKDKGVEVGLVSGGGLQPDGLVLVTDARVGDEGAGEHRTEQLEHLRGVDRGASRLSVLRGSQGVLTGC